MGFHSYVACEWKWVTFAVGAICSLVILTVALVRGVESISAVLVTTAVVSLGLTLRFEGKEEALSEIKKEIIEEIALDAMDSLEATEGSDE